MIKYYCDICGTEITPENKKPATFTGKKVSTHGLPKRELMVQLVEHDPCGDEDACVCKYCMIDAIKSADDRPMEGAA